MNPGRRRGAAACSPGPARPPPRRGGGPGARRACAKPVPPDAVGMLYDTTLLHRLQGLRGGLPRGQRACEPDTGLDGLYDAPLDLNGSTKNVIKLYKEGDARSFFKAQCMHCVDPACAAPACCGSLHEGRDDGHRRATTRPTASAAATARWPVPFNVPKFEFDKAVPKIVKCELCRHRVGDAADAGGFTATRGQARPAARSARARRRDLRQARRAPRRGQAPDRREPRTLRAERSTARPRRRHAGALPLARAVREARAARATGRSGVPTTAYTIQDGLYQGFVAPVALYVGARRGAVPQPRSAPVTEEVEP